MAKSTLDEWIYLFKNSAIKSDFKAKGIKKAGKVLDKMNMTQEERLAYDNYIYHKRAALGDFRTAVEDGVKKRTKEIEDKLQEKDIQLQEKDSQLQEKDSQLQEKDSQLQEKDNKLQQLAKMLLANGISKEQIFKQTGIKL